MVTLTTKLLLHVIDYLFIISLYVWVLYAYVSHHKRSDNLARLFRMGEGVL